jgi:hypothetical protein
LAIFLVLAVLGRGAIAQEPSLDIIMRIQADGTAPFDATTFDPSNPALNGGTDANGTNGIVRLLDYVTYRAEVSINDANQTNVVVRFTADTDQKWTAVPTVCQKTENNPSINPTSEIVDLATPGDQRVLICNVGAQPQGTKFVIKPVAQVKGLGTNATLADKTVCDGVPMMAQLDPSSGCVSAFATVKSAEQAAAVESNYVSVLTTAAFKINLSKTSPPLTVNPAPAYGPRLRNQPGPTGLNVGNGQVVEWVVTAQAAKGSEPIKPDANGQRNFVLTDMFVDDNPNNNVGTGDGSSNVNRSSNARLFSWNAQYAACEAMGVEIGSINCAQGGGTGAGVGQNGAPITVTLNNVNVTYPEIEGRVFKFKMRLWVPINSNQAAPNNHDIMSNTGLCSGSPVICTTNLTNHITGLDTPNPALDGASPVITSATNQQNYSGAGDPGGTAPGSGDNQFTVPVDSAVPGGGPFMVGGKSFYDNASVNGGSHPGTKTVSPGEIVPLALNMWGNGLIADGYPGSNSGYARVCDPIDTNNFEFAGTPANGEIHPFLYGNNPIYSPSLMGSPNFKDAHYLWDGNAIIMLQSSDGKAQVVPTDRLAHTQFKVEYTDTVHTNDPLSLRDYNCNNGQNWVTDPTSLSGGKSSVTAIRMTFSNIDPAEIRALHDVSADDPTAAYVFSFHNFKVKEAAPGYVLPNATLPGTYLPNFSHSIQSADGTGEIVSRAALSSTDPNNADFSRSSYWGDRVRLVSAKMGITKELVDSNQKVIRPGETATFRVTPYLFGQYATPVNLTVTDTYPNTPTQMTFVSAEIDPACATTNGTYGSFNGGATSMNVTITGVTAGQPICPLLVTLRAPAGAKAGTYLNNATITSSDTAINNNSIDATTGQPPKAATSVVILAVDGYYIQKDNDSSVYEVNKPITQRLTYSNLGSENYTAGSFIDILPYNGDHGNSTLREDTLTPNVGAGSAYTNADGGSNSTTVGLVGAPAGTNGEIFVYTTVDPATIPLDPCHSANQSAGFIPTSGHYCYQAYVDNGNMFVDGVAAGTGLISWSSTAPANWADVTAVRWTSTAHNAGTAARTVTLSLAPKNNQEGDLYCNNFAGRIPQIALVIISNDVCEKVVSGQITGTIFNDAAANGGNFAINTSDATYQNIQVQLFNMDGTAYDTDPVTAGIQSYVLTTDTNGNYTFTNLPSGSYIVRVLNAPTIQQTYDLDDPSPPIPTTFTTANSSGAFTLAGPATNATLSDVQDKLAVDFGYTAGASLGNFVWHDTNANGLQETGESGISDVTVELLDALGNVLKTTTTNTNGFYQFSDLPQGDYAIRITPPIGYAVSPANSGGDDTKDSDIDPMTFTTPTLTLSAGESNTTLDAGFYLGSIGDYVWLDKNGDAVQDLAEAGIGGVTVELRDASTGTVIKTAMTDSTGHYAFTDLPAGSYQVHVVPPTNAIMTTVNQDQAGVLVAGQSDLTYDFGFRYDPNLVDPPEFTKEATLEGDIIHYKMVWINQSTINDVRAHIEDVIPAGTTYRQGTIVCEARGVSVTESCNYNLVTNLISWDGMVGADDGNIDEVSATNEVVITFDVLLAPSTTEVVNQAESLWDQNGDGVINGEDENYNNRLLGVSNDPTTTIGDDPTSVKRTLVATPAAPLTGDFFIGGRVIIIAGAVFAVIGVGIVAARWYKVQ